MINLGDESYRFAKKSKTEILKKFIGTGIVGNQNPEFIFMAGAPGAGKTEYSKSLIKTLSDENPIKINGIVRIDADEIRSIFTEIGYTGKNANEYSRGCNKGMEILFDRCVKNKYHTVVDGTFSSLSVVSRNIESAIKIGAVVTIIYVYQDPVLAWGFTKLREQEEGRMITKDFFIKSLFQSKENVDSMKKKYGSAVSVWLVEKNIDNSGQEVTVNIDKIDNYIKIKHNSESLNEILIL